MTDQLPNGQDILNDLRRSGRWARGYFGSLAEWQNDADYQRGRMRVEELYGRGADYDKAARQGWADAGK